MNRNLLPLLSLIVISILLFSCKKEEVAKLEVYPKLSDYKMYQGKYSDLIPSSNYHLYEESSMLFTDSCEKQRLILLPAGTKMTATVDGLPSFPEGTILAKTFYYFNDKRDHSKGKKIIETRVLIYTDGAWTGGTYEWNAEQTDGVHITEGKSMPVSWIDEIGKPHAITFSIASDIACFTCHKDNNKIVPVGPQIKHLNMDVTRDNKKVNQLTYFQNIGLMNTMNPASFSKVADSEDTSLSVADRARGYLDINCGYCHSKTGDAALALKKIYFNYEYPIEQTNIKSYKTDIIKEMAKGTMPKIRSFLIDDRAVALVTQYLNELP